jgi:predicted DNA-binding transcriptional regulator AlpA
LDVQGLAPLDVKSESSAIFFQQCAAAPAEKGEYVGMTGKDIGLSAVKGTLITTKEIAAFLRTSERWVQSHMNDGTFPFAWFLIGERLHAADSYEIDKWLISIRIEAGTAVVPKKAIKKIIQEEVKA